MNDIFTLHLCTGFSIITCLFGLSSSHCFASKYVGYSNNAQKKSFDIRNNTIINYVIITPFFTFLCNFFLWGALTINTSKWRAGDSRTYFVLILYCHLWYQRDSDIMKIVCFLRLLSDFGNQYLKMVCTVRVFQNISTFSPFTSVTHL